MRPLSTPRRLTRRAELYEQWATLLAAGVPMLQALATLQRSAFIRSHGRMLSRVIERLEAGDPLPHALAPEQRFIPTFDQALLRAGDRSGRLDICLKDLARQYRLQAKWLNQAISACMYPALLLVLSLVVFPVDLIVTIFTEGDWMPFLMHKARIAGGMIAGVLLVVACLSLRPGARWIGALAEQVSWRIPILGAALRERALARLILALEALLNTGMGVGEAWSAAADASGSIRLEREVRRWAPELDRGYPISESLAESRLIPDLFTDAYRIGETSGKLEDTLRHLREHYDGSSLHTLEQLATWIPRIIYLAVLARITLSVLGFWRGYGAQFDAYF